MNEIGFWRKVKLALHRPRASERRGVAWKVQDAFNAGLPDADVALRRRDGSAACVKLELKYEPAWPVRGGAILVNVTENQLRFLQEWETVAPGLAWVLLGVGREWFLLAPGALPGPKPRLTQEEIRSLAAASGSFEVLAVGLFNHLTGEHDRQQQKAG